MSTEHTPPALIVLHASDNVAVARVALARMGGAASTLVALVAPDAEPEGDRVYELSSIRSWWRRWTRRRALLLNIDVETVDFARRTCVRAERQPARVRDA